MMDQRTPEWFAARVGRVTASRIADLMARTKTGPSASRANYLAQLVAERLTGETEQGFTSAAMQHGIDTEAEARNAYEFVTGTTVVETGFMPHPSIHWAGASPDGLIGDDGLIEIKCPNTSTHIATLRGGAVPDKYVKQMQFQMACTGRQWCDFASYDPRLPLPMRLHVSRIERDEALIAEIEAAVSEFLAEVEETVAALSTAYLKEAA